MKVSTAGIKLIACGALVAFGLTVGAGTAHAALIEPTADQCKSYAQEAIDEGEDETLAQELVEHDLDPAGCPAPAPATECSKTMDSDGDFDCNSDDEPVPSAECSKTIDSDGDFDCNSDDEPVPVTVPSAECSKTMDFDGDFDCNSDDEPVPATVPSAECSKTIDSDGDFDCNSDDDVATGASESRPVVVPVAPVVAPVIEGVTVSNAAPVAVVAAAAATPIKAATPSTPVIAATATPAAATADKALPRTGGDISGIVLLALASLGIGGALLRLDKRRRLAA